MYYVISKNGLLVGVTTENAYSFNLPDVNIHEFDGLIPDLNSMVWNSDSESFVGSGEILTQLAFLNRFTMQERLAIRASTNPIVSDIMKLLEVANFISVKDSSAIQSVYYLASIGLIDQTRISEILQ